VIAYVNLWLSDSVWLHKQVPTVTFYLSQPCNGQNDLHPSRAFVCGGSEQTNPPGVVYRTAAYG
jgi:hypothetical protein